MVEDLNQRLKEALANERGAGATVTKIRERIAAAKDAADRARGERQLAAQRVAAGETVNLGRILQAQAHAEGEIELLGESLALAEARLKEAQSSTTQILAGLAQQRVSGVREKYEAAMAGFHAAVAERERRYQELNSATQLVGADGEKLRSVFHRELEEAS